MVLESLFLWKESYDKPSASHSLGRLSSIGMLVNNFIWTGPLRRPRCISQCLFGGSIVTIMMARSTRSRLDVSKAREAETSRWERVLLPI